MNVKKRSMAAPCQKLLHALMLSLIAGWGSSCVSHRQLVNFNEGGDFPVAPEIIAQAPELRIQPRDVIAISVQTLLELNPTDVMPFRTQNINPVNTGVDNSIAYQVDRNGFIDFPMVGRVKVSGLTLYEAKDTLTTLLQRDFQNPVVNVRFTNFRFTIIGEVRSPATYALPDDRVSILDALGLAGDLTSYANRRNILIVREQNGQREYGRINIQSREMFQSPYFYLRPNDFIYVEPLKAKVGTVTDQASKAAPWIGVGAAILNLIIIIITQR